VCVVGRLRSYITWAQGLDHVLGFGSRRTLLPPARDVAMSDETPRRSKFASSLVGSAVKAAKGALVGCFSFVCAGMMPCA
jgi:hypothetical protein